MEDKRDILKNEKPFDYRLIKDEKAQITFYGKTIKVIKGKEYLKLQRVLDLDNSYELQLFLAKVTGHFKH